MRSQPLALALTAAFALSTAACSPSGDDRSASILAPPSETFVVGDRSDDYVLRLGLVNVCAFWTYPPPTAFTATFSASASGGTVLSGNFTISNPPLCVEVWNATGSTASNVAASLVSNAASWQLSRIVTSVGNLVDDATFTTLTGQTSASVNVNDASGGYIWFKFEPKDVPSGGQGCTPGYWKQSQHFGSWTAPYTPTTAFSAVFSNAFPGMTLLQVLGQGGGGMKALGRHSVAALLNAASGDVAYDQSVAQVISSFNSAYASGNAGTIERQKDLFDMLNNLGCPLARSP